MRGRIFNKMNQDEVLTFTGDTLKSLGDGRVGGYLVRFTDANTKDLSGEYFTDKTYYGARDGDGIDCLFHHSQPIAGIDASYTDHIFAPIKTRRDAVGIFGETVLNMADEYERKVAELVDAGKLGWSSGAASHTCRKSADGEILRWILAEGSLTPSPCDSANHGGIRPLKSLAIEDAEAFKAAMTLPAVSAAETIQIEAAPIEAHEPIVAALKSLPLTQFLTAMGAVAELTERRLSWYDNERSTKQGRPISADNLASMQAIHSGMAGHVAALGAMIDKHTSKDKAEADKPAAEAKAETLLDVMPDAETVSAARARSVQALFMQTQFNQVMAP